MQMLSSFNCIWNSSRDFLCLLFFFKCSLFSFSPFYKLSSRFKCLSCSFLYLLVFPKYFHSGLTGFQTHESFQLLDIYIIDIIVCTEFISVHCLASHIVLLYLQNITHYLCIFLIYSYLYYFITKLDIWKLYFIKDKISIFLVFLHISHAVDVIQQKVEKDTNYIFTTKHNSFTFHPIIILAFLILISCDKYSCISN